MTPLIVTPHLGVGPIHLGISRAQLVERLGEPDHREKLSFLDDETTEYFEYESMELELGFSTDDGDKLGVIRCGSESLRLNEQKVIGIELADFLAAHPAFEEEEESEDGTTDYSNEDLDLSVTTARGRVVSLSLFPAWSDEDEPIWPSPQPS